MLDLLTKYEVQDILIFIVILALAIKGLISFYDWASARLDLTYEKKNKLDEQLKYYETQLKNQEKLTQELIENNKQIFSELKGLKGAIQRLTDSDRDDIRLCITEKFHICTERNWVDDYTLSCLEKRFSCYQAEGGNSFVEGMMEALRALPRRPND